ncbi:MAG: T9SS type A sorting domain-containing protein [Ignavibacteriaceae bacterium]
MFLLIFSFYKFTTFSLFGSGLSRLGDKGKVFFNVDLIDDMTGNVIGTLDKAKLSSSGLPFGRMLTNHVNTSGMENKTVRIRLTLDDNIKADKNFLIEKYGNGSVMGKSTVKEITVQGNEMVKSYALDQNYPNPFNPSTIISYQIPSDGIVTVKVFDPLGREVKTLVNEFKSQGRYSVSFDASQLASGVYFYQLKSGDYISTKKMILLK